MENATYYLEGERLVFLTEEDARDYFFLLTSLRTALCEQNVRSV